MTKRVFMWSVGITVITVLAGAVAGLSSRSGPHAPQQNDHYLDLWNATARQRQALYQWASDMASTLASNGMEPNAAGFHVLRPREDPLWDIKYGFAAPSGGFYWWIVPEHYPTLLYQPIMETLDEGDTCLVSYDRPFENTLASYDVVSAGNGYGLRATFSEGTIGALSLLLAPKYINPVTYEYQDWIARTRQSTEASTEYKVVLVSNNSAYLPVSISDIVDSSPVQLSVIVADNLTLQEANALLALVQS